MIVKELVDMLSRLPQDARVFYGCDEGRSNLHIPGKILFDIQVLYYPEVTSYGNSSPKPPHLEENIVVLEVY